MEETLNFLGRIIKFQMNSQDVFFPIIDGIILDLKGLSSINHSCASNNCKISQCCCSHYEVLISKAELSNIINVIPHASQYSRNLRLDKDFGNVFEDEGRNTYSIDKNDNGFCVFGYKAKGRKVLCSLHQAAVDMKIPINSVKPLACILWPLALVESEPIILSVQEEVSIFPCNQDRTSSTLLLDRGIAQNIEIAFGGAFLNKILKKIEALNGNSRGSR
ncbi:MAG: DUF3109 family protein [Desulfobacteraceae bacterium]|nr:DUF3109 family protein [Desulfobacteraceae bacterium]MBU4054548.1 DUF3109 family protein [Pseudomonadota bacterium]